MWNQQNKSEIACILASLILHENSMEISEELLKKILLTSKIKTQNYWFYLFPKLTEGMNFRELIGISTLAKTNNKENPQNDLVKKEEEEEVVVAAASSSKDSEENMGFGLFD